MKATRNFVFLLISNTVGQLFTLMAFVELAEVFGPVTFGQFSFAQVFILYFIHLADFGLQTFGTRVIAQAREDEFSQVVLEITTLRMFLALVASGILAAMLFTMFEPGVERELALIFALSLFPFALLLEWFFQGIERMEIVAIGRILRGAVFYVLVFALVDRKEDVAMASVFNVIGVVASSMALGWIYLKKFRMKGTRLQQDKLWGILWSAYPLAAGSFVSQVNYNFGTLALGLYLSKDAVGVFSASHRLILFLWVFVAMAAANAILPALARTAEKSISEFESLSKGLLKVFVMGAIPIGVGGTILSAEIINFFFTPEYQEAVLVFQIAIWIVVAVALRIVIESMLIALKSGRHYFRGYIVAGMITLIGNLILVPVFGLIAPVLVGLASEVFLLIFFLSVNKMIPTAELFRTTVKPAIAGLMMGAVLLLIPLPLFIAICLGAVCYFTFLVILRFISMNEIINFVADVRQ